MNGKGGLGVAAFVAAPLLVVGGLLAAILLIFGPAQEAGACAPGRTVDLQKIADTPIAGYSGEQLENAAHIMNAATTLHLDRGAQILGVMAAMTESELRSLDHSTGTDPSQRGLFQQPDEPEWGSLADRMDPTLSATNFFLQLQTVNSWASLPPSIAVFRVQGGADPYRFEKSHADAALVVGTLAGGGEVVERQKVFPRFLPGPSESRDAEAENKQEKKRGADHGSHGVRGNPTRPRFSGNAICREARPSMPSATGWKSRRHLTPGA